MTEVKRSIVVACDGPPEQFEGLINATVGVPGISGYKLGCILGLQGLERAVRLVDQFSRNKNHPLVIYDHQKGGTDIPKMGSGYARVIKDSGVDAAILFPLSGPQTLQLWTESCLKVGLRVLVGLAMTHENFFISEGGWVDDYAPEKAFRLACKLGVRDFVVPGNKLNWVVKLRLVLDGELGAGNFTLWSPGFIDQKGEITECGKVAGRNWHAIIGSAIYNHATFEEMHEAAKKLGQDILALT